MPARDDQNVSRRDMLRRSLAGAAGVYGAELLDRKAAGATAGAYPSTEPTSANEFDFTAGSAALQADKTVNTACPFCNSNCRLIVHLKAGRIIDITGEKSDPVQAGGLCVKGPMMMQMVYNRHRLTRPLKRVGGEKGSTDSAFEPVSWEEALDTIARKFVALRDAGESRAIANKTSGRMPRGIGSLVGRFFTLLGSPNDTDVGPVCNDAGGDALVATFGVGCFTNGYGIDGATGNEDLGASRYFLFLGTNQAETQPVTFAYLLRGREKTKAKLVVIDPRLTPTGAQADEWIAPKPHTDLALVLGMLHHIVTNELHDKAFVARWVLGFDQLRKHLVEHGYTAEWAAGVTDLPAAKIRQIANDYATTKPAAIFCNAGISHQLSAFDTYRVLAFLAAVTGNVGVPGAGCNFMHNTWPGDLRLPPLNTPTPPRGVALPVGPDSFAEAILSGKPCPLKAAITCGNPLLASANTSKVAEAYRTLEFYVYTGLFMEESAYYADIILPVCSGLEFDGVYMRRDDRGIRWQHAAVPRVGECKTDWEIWIELAHAMAKVDPKNPPTYWTDAFPLEWKNYSALWSTFLAHTPGMGGMTQQRLERRSEPLRWPCPSESHPGVSTLYLDHLSWYEAAESLDAANKGKRFLTRSGKVELFTPELDAKLAPAGHQALPTFYTHPEVTGRHPTIASSSEMVRNPINPQAWTPRVAIGQSSEDAVQEQFPLMGIIGRPSVVHFSSMTQWTTTGKQMNGIRLIQIHPDAAKAAGIADGSDVIVESPRGSVFGTALLWSGIRPDTIFVPNTFGPRQAVADEMGTPRYEAANLLTDDRYFDNLSGQQAYKCFACRIKKA